MQILKKITRDFMAKLNRVVIAGHVYATGPGHDLRDYLLRRGVEKVFFISHPLFYDATKKGPGCEIYCHGRKKTEHYQQARRYRAVGQYLRDFFRTLHLVHKFRDHYQLFFGVDNLNALAGIWLRRFGLVDKVVYYVIDYNPHRFPGKILNRIYHWVDRAAVKGADETWNLSPRMAEARLKYFGIPRGRQKTVPIGIWYQRFPLPDLAKTPAPTLIFMGHLLKKQGVQYVLRAVPQIVKAVPAFQLLVIGGGDYLGTLKSLARQLKVERYVHFTGFVENHQEVERLLSSGAAAVAMYEARDEQGARTFTYYADPGKLKSYLAGGLPVLLTDVPYNARMIAQARCGLVISEDPQAIAQAVISLFQDSDKLKNYRQNARRYAGQFDWPKIFRKALNTLPYDQRKTAPEL